MSIREEPIWSATYYAVVTVGLAASAVEIYLAM
jgi:hypothetical protein